MLAMSQHKFASNVIEKCIQFGAPKERQMIIEELVPRGDIAILLIMMKDQYANYVVQKVIDSVDEPTRDNIITKIKPHVPSLRRYTYSKHTLSRIEKYTKLN